MEVSFATQTYRDGCGLAWSIFIAHGDAERPLNSGLRGAFIVAKTGIKSISYERIPTGLNNEFLRLNRELNRAIREVAALIRNPAFAPILRRFAVAGTPIVLVRAMSLHRHCRCASFLLQRPCDCRHRRWSGDMRDGTTRITKPRFTPMDRRRARG